jgi:hypothetical protein
MTTLIPIIKESERLFEEKMHKYICNCVIEQIDNCPRVAKVKAEFISSQLALLEGLKKEVEGMKIKMKRGFVNKSDAGWGILQENKTLIDKISSSLEESITYLKNK